MADKGYANSAPERTKLAESFESRRSLYQLILILFSVGVILTMFIVIAIQFNGVFSTDAAVISLVTTTTTVIGTLVGFYFGSQVGSAGFARADAARQETVQILGDALGSTTTQDMRPMPNGGSSPAPPTKSPTVDEEEPIPQ